MAYRSRQEIFEELFPGAPAFRWRQVEKAFFVDGWRGWSDVSNLPKDMAAALAADMPWMSNAKARIVENAAHDTWKAALELIDGKCVETVLMKNRRGDWTVCVSSQIGCAMKCAFCATGRMGLTRDLHSDEIVDQYRFWRGFLHDKKLAGRLSNLVFMGMGEPLANYDNVKRALNLLLEQTDIGPTRITVSTVGLLPRLEGILTDKDWPPVRLAVSLHSAEPLTRKRIMPTTHDEFLPRLADWCQRYVRKLGNRRHYLTFEYVLLAGINDSDEHAGLLADFAKAAGRVKINLIPYNYTGGEFQGSDPERTRRFLELLAQHGLNTTRRRSMGDDIAAACGQLITLGA
jgi:23S rRNA (adenine2503-C2)-methyltransferase